jgi:hypothetical protein
MIIVIILVVAILVSLIVGVYQYKMKIFGSYIPPNPLKKNGLLVLLNPEDIVIKSRNYWEDQEVEISRTNMIDSIYGREKPIQKEKKVVSVLVYEGQHNGKLVKYVSPPLYKNEESIRSIMSRLKSITVYVDRENENNYYFDITPFAGI